MTMGEPGVTTLPRIQHRGHGYRLVLKKSSVMSVANVWLLSTRRSKPQNDFLGLKDVALESARLMVLFMAKQTSYKRTGI